MKMKRLLALLSMLILSITLSACSSWNQNAPQKVTTSKKLPETYFQNANQQKQNQAGQDVQIHMITKSLKNNYKGLFKVSYDKSINTIRLVPINKSVKQLITLSNQNNSSAITNWNQFVGGVRKTSISVSKQVKGNNIKLSIYDPNNNKLLYTSANGKALKNVF